MCAGDDIGVALAGELTHDGTSHPPAVACYIYFGFFVHFFQLCALGGLSRVARLGRLCRGCALRESCAVGNIMLIFYFVMLIVVVLFHTLVHGFPYTVL